jgi:hypothetical protein
VTVIVLDGNGYGDCTPEKSRSMLLVKKAAHARTTKIIRTKVSTSCPTISAVKNTACVCVCVCVYVRGMKSLMG